MFPSPHRSDSDDQDVRDEEYVDVDMGSLSLGLRANTRQQGKQGLEEERVRMVMVHPQAGHQSSGPRGMGASLEAARPRRGVTVK